MHSAPESPTASILYKQEKLFCLLTIFVKAPHRGQPIFPGMLSQPIYPLVPLIISIRSAASMVMSIVYDTPALTDSNDPKLVAFESFVRKMSYNALPGTRLVEFMPWMRYLPTWLAPWKREALKDEVDNTAMFAREYNAVRQRVVSF